MDDALAAVAEAEGWEVLRLRLFDTKPGSQVADLARWLASAPLGAALAWTSRRAASVLAASALPRLRAALERIPLFAVGEESAAPIGNAGIAVEVPRERLGAANLAEQLIGRAQALGIRRVAFLHGDRALADLPDALARAGIAVERFELYRTEYLDADASPIARTAVEGRPCVLVCFSPSGIAGLERLLEPAAAGALHRHAVAIARGETTYKTLLRWGYEHARRPMGAAAEPFDGFVRNALQSTERKTR
jgi:uroporphyrinogen-III synthase